MKPTLRYLYRKACPKFPLFTDITWRLSEHKTSSEISLQNSDQVFIQLSIYSLQGKKNILNDGLGIQSEKKNWFGETLEAKKNPFPRRINCKEKKKIQNESTELRTNIKRGWLHNTVKVLNATESFTLKWLILCSVHFT